MTNEFLFDDETRVPEEATLNALFEHLQAHEMHINGKRLEFKGEAMKAVYNCDDEHVGDIEREKLLASKVSHNEISEKEEDSEDKEGDLVRLKISRREAFFQEVKKDLTAWKNSSGDSDDSEHTYDSFMAKSDEEDADEKLTLSYFK